MKQLTFKIHLHKKHQLQGIDKIKKMKSAGSTKEIYVDMRTTNADINIPLVIDYQQP